MLVSGANRHGSMFKRCIDTLPVVNGLQGKLRGRLSLHADKGYDYARYRACLKKQGMLYCYRPVASQYSHCLRRNCRKPRAFTLIPRPAPVA